MRIPLHAELCTLGDILPLRQEVLRPGFPIEACRFEKDTDPGTLHYRVSITGSPKGTIACATTHKASPNGSHKEALFQLRGMAVSPDYQKEGIGGYLLAFVEWFISASRRHPGDGLTVWCHARMKAVSFYQKHGWEIVSDMFEIKGVGPHRRMRKSLAE